MKFPYLLFDADDTLFDFPKAAARAFFCPCAGATAFRIRWIPAALYHRIQPGAVGSL